ncbi:hypothetical protein CK228_34105 [Mesorhizobium sp. WSM4312]|uniref:hypothetical protein n=1 Tax=Mesorhizobium sp. WSM4312 TaxID=2029411 RepID=UPI000BAEFFA2|nr:hypothetical protein [Mesorhizobium sp. WSM4312]PBB64241.1 hypothetical protein CK228_34105 [Mesorhizobium sp. WSM4312]
MLFVAATLQRNGDRQWPGPKPSKQLSQAEIECFLVAAEALHKSIVKPFISPHCEHYRPTRCLHEAPLKTVREVTGKEVEFIRWNTTGPLAPL